MGDELNLLSEELRETIEPAGAAVGSPTTADLVPVEGSENYVVLRMDELLPDSGGEVVIYDDVGEGLAIVTDEPVAGQGVSADHVTASGLDVQGFSFTTFESGITIFYPSESKLLVLNETV
jgi:hypothetical protein